MHACYPPCEVCREREERATQPAPQAGSSGEGLKALELYRRMVVCKQCGNKRCPHAQDTRYICTGSNKPDQLGDPLFCQCGHSQMIHCASGCSLCNCDLNYLNYADDDTRISPAQAEPVAVCECGKQYAKIDEVTYCPDCTTAMTGLTEAELRQALAEPVEAKEPWKPKKGEKMYAIVEFDGISASGDAHILVQYGDDHRELCVVEL